MLWQLVAFLKDKSIAAVPKPWIKKSRNSVQCYWPTRNVEALRKKVVQPSLKKNEKNFYGCKILLKGEIFHSFREALAAEMKLTALPPKKSYEKASYVKSNGKNQHSAAQAYNSPLITVAAVKTYATNDPVLAGPAENDSVMTEPEMHTELITTKRPLNTENKLIVENRTVADHPLNADQPKITNIVPAVKTYATNDPVLAGPDENDSVMTEPEMQTELITTKRPLNTENELIVENRTVADHPLNADQPTITNIVPAVKTYATNDPVLAGPDENDSVMTEPEMQTELITTKRPLNTENELIFENRTVADHPLNADQPTITNIVPAVKTYATNDPVLAGPDENDSVMTEANTADLFTNNEQSMFTEPFISELVFADPMVNNKDSMGTVTNYSNGMKKIENESNSSFVERKFWKKNILKSYQFDSEIEKMETADVTQTYSSPVITVPVVKNFVMNDPVITSPDENNDVMIGTDSAEPDINTELIINREQSMFAEPFISEVLFADPMINIHDYFDVPIIGMNFDFGLSDHSKQRNTEQEENVEWNGLLSNEGDFALHESISYENEEMIPKNIERGEATALNNVLEYLMNEGNDDVASEVTYVLNSGIDGSVEVEVNYETQSDSSKMITNQGAGCSVDAQCNYGSADSCQNNKDAISEPGQPQQQIGDSEYYIHHLGSNNYSDAKCYLYTKNNYRKSNLYLRCKNSVKHHCPARVTVRENNYKDAVMTIGHNHPPDKQISDRQIFDKKLEENINRDPFQTPRQVYLSTKAELKDTIDLTNIPSLKKKEGFIYRRQRKYVPPLPTTIDEFEKYILDEKYRQFFTKDHRNLPYFRGIWTSTKGERNLVFISETTLRLINTMNHIALFMDGTYKALPHHISFRQLYVISVTYENQCYPLAYIFMEKKTFTSYDTIFQHLKFLMPSVEVVKLMTDYEAATRKALKKHYPNARLAGCFFHYVQAMVKSTKRFGLRNDERFQDAIKKICHLALLPNELILEGFQSIDDSLRNIESTRWERFRKYWQKQWGSANISVYGLVDRSNNFSESNNKSLNLLNLKNHPNIWHLIKNLKLLEMDKSDQIGRAIQAEMIETKKNRDVIAFNEKVAKATRLPEEDQDVSRFLQRVTYGENVELFVKNQVNIMDDSGDTDIDDEMDEDVIPNNYNRESDFRRNHPREAAVRPN